MWVTGYTSCLFHILPLPFWYLAGTKLYFLVTEAHVCEQFVQSLLGSGIAEVKPATSRLQV